MKPEQIAFRTSGVPLKITILILIHIIVFTTLNLQAATYYVRTDGGSASQCTGLSNAAYPGSGSAQACAWNNPQVAIPPAGTSPRIAGGDTLYISSGTYYMGSSGYMQPIPGGSSASARTKILGSNCSAPPKLVGTNSTTRLINMDGSSNIELGCLEITDEHDCVLGSQNSAAVCAVGIDSYAKTGVYARNSSNLWLHDINIHGLASNGLQAGALTDLTMERVKINKNGRVGWDMNVNSGGAASNFGNITLRNIEVGWNGCGERVSTGEAWACFGQNSGGYGDGIGTVTTTGNWLIEDSSFHHNTQDGLDLRYMDGAESTNVTLRRVYAEGNAGNQVKVRGNSLIENSVFIGNCSFFKSQYDMADLDICRADGSNLALVLTGDDIVTARHNTLAGEGWAQFSIAESVSSDAIYLQNNVVFGFPYYHNPANSTIFNNTVPASVNRSGNLSWQTSSCLSGNTCNYNPLLTNMGLHTFDGRPLSNSPVIDTAPVISAVTSDFLNNPRPSGSAPDIGAYEFQYTVYSYSWVVTADWGACSAVACGTSGTQTRTVQCQRNDGAFVGDVFCTSPKPATSQSCSAPACTFIITAGPSVSEITQVSATVTWSLSENATGQVQYGTTTNYGNYSTLEPSFNWSTHIQRLSNLSPGTLYHYRVISRNAAGAEVVSPDNTFTTLGAPLTITSGPTASGITQSSATIAWSLSEGGTGQIQYGTTTNYGSLSTAEPNYLTSHSQMLSNLQPGTLYHYRVVSYSASGSQAISTDQTFTTLGTPFSIIAGPTAINITKTSATIKWTLSENATGQVEYGLTNNYGSVSTLEPSFNWSTHEQDLTGLKRNKTYHYRVVSRNAAGAVVYSTDHTFTTAP